MNARALVVSLLSLCACGLGEGGAPDALDSVDQALHTPACADIVSGAAAFDGSTVRLVLGFAAPPCERIAYTVRVTNNDGVLGEQTQAGATLAPVGDGTQLAFTVPAVTSGTVCVYVTTAHQARLLDRAPDAEGSCVVLAPNVAGEYRFE